MTYRVCAAQRERGDYYNPKVLFECDQPDLALAVKTAVETALEVAGDAGTMAIFIPEIEEDLC